MLTFVLAWAAFYALSIGPFIAVSEFEKKVTGRYRIGCLARAYRPLVIVGYLPRPLMAPLLWYAERWIPPYATGLPVTPHTNRDSAAPILGTWKYETGAVFDFRPDGTARYRSIYGAEIQYLEWTVDSEEFAVYQYSRKYSNHAVAWFARRVMLHDGPADRYRIVETAPAQFRLRHSSGKILSFTAVQDKGLQLAP